MRRNTIVIVIIVVLAIGLIVYLIAGNSNNRDYSWTPSYRPESEQPFGGMVIYELLDSYFPGHSMQTVNYNIDKALRDADGHTTYFFLGSTAYYSDSTFNDLKEFVRRGNDAFFGVDVMPDQLESLLADISTYHGAMPDTTWYVDQNGDSVYYTQNNGYGYTSGLENIDSRKNKMNFTDSIFHRDTAYNFSIVIKEEVQSWDWNYFLSTYLAKLESYEPLGTGLTDNFYNFIRIPYGSGYFYVHVNPLAFTNYFLIQKDKKEYAEKALSYLSSGDILWDEESRSYPHTQNQSEGPLKYILSQRSLRWAWYCLIASLLLYLAFRAKRMQQPIPVTEKNENKSLEFVQTIGRMYLLRKNHHQLGQQKIKLFYQFISERYKIPLAPNEKGFLDKLHLKSEIPLTDIEAIFKQAKYMEHTDVNADDLIELHIMLQSFYTHCK
ncbi:MAG: DUF4350 domain-containing protein [Chitinophagales bacterium]